MPTESIRSNWRLCFGVMLCHVVKSKQVGFHTLFLILEFRHKYCISVTITNKHNCTLLFEFYFNPPSSSVVRKNAAMLYCCETPEIFLIAKLSIGMGVSR